MNRRQFAISVALATGQAMVKPAAAQQPQSIEDLRKLVSNPSEVELLLARSDLMVALLALAEVRIRPPLPPASQAPYFQLRRVFVFVDPKERERIIKELSSNNAEVRLQTTFKVLQPALDKLPGLLVKVGLTPGSPLATEAIQGFSTFCQLAGASGVSSSAWWCECYGLRLLC